MLAKVILTTVTSQGHLHSQQPPSGPCTTQGASSKEPQRSLFRPPQVGSHMDPHPVTYPGGLSNGPSGRSVQEPWVCHQGPSLVPAGAQAHVGSLIILFRKA